MTDAKPADKPIPESAIKAVATAMAKAVHIGDGDPPRRDVMLFHERAKLFLAASEAVKALPADRPSAAEIAKTRADEQKAAAEKLAQEQKEREAVAEEAARQDAIRLAALNAQGSSTNG